MHTAITQPPDPRLTDCSDSNTYSFIADVDGMRFVYCPERTRVVPIAVQGIPLAAVGVTSFFLSVRICDLKSLEGVLSGAIELMIQHPSQTIEQRSLTLQEVQAHLYPIRACTLSAEVEL
ncbi:hypothetical protein [Acaryochloris sp. CCMEE 5410]|uniref:hypothetical protein n=1 Tax=Acaryochloris sp. CCMEE 5410 TaxID=310037 RepID=UPI00024852B6|nr:hypothetical protein [Acaryochloris sp. CCMEE 5410]KAI9130196.1 hypothetical protein ON05_031725 [Acaryochloris sp. CCMEE 5410]